MIERSNQFLIFLYIGELVVRLCFEERQRGIHGSFHRIRIIHLESIEHSANISTLIYCQISRIANNVEAEKCCWWSLVFDFKVLCEAVINFRAEFFIWCQDENIIDIDRNNDVCDEVDVYGGI